MTLCRRLSSALFICALTIASIPARAELSSEELAKLAQNPVGNLISVPFQDNIGLNYGPDNKTQNVLNIQPVVPVSVSDDWNVIARTILPVISQPRLGPFVGSQQGSGDTSFTAFLSPAHPSGVIWGVGHFHGGVYLTSSPIITVNWKARSEDEWSVPIGGGAGKIFHFGKLPVNAQIDAYYNVEKPEFGADWTIRAQVQLMFPK